MKKKILVVDDEVELVDLLKSRLEENDYEVFEAYDGEEGVEKARKENPDLMILDLMLPKMNGYKVCSILKSDLYYARTPIIIYTAVLQDEERKLCEAVGANAYFTKPVEPETLLRKMEELIQAKE